MNVLGDTLGYLRQLQADGVEPAAALAGISRLSERHRDTPVDLVWLEEPFDRSIHYDALIHLPGDGTVSLSFSPDSGLPWPLRGVQRWRDRDLARVNDIVLTVDHAITQLDFVWDQAPIVRRLVDGCLIQETLQREPIDLDDRDLQEAMDAFRRAHRLFAAQDTHRWLVDQGFSSEKLEQLLRDQATLRKLRERVAAGRVGEYFEAHRDELATLALLRLDFADQERARATLDAARRGAAFETVARCAIAEAFAGGQPPPLLESVVMRRRDVDKLELLPTAAREGSADRLGAASAAALVDEVDTPAATFAAALVDEVDTPAATFAAALVEADTLGAAFAASLVEADTLGAANSAASLVKTDTLGATFAASLVDRPDPPGATFAASLVDQADPLAALFAAQPGDVLGPLASERGAALLQVLGVRPACLDERTRQTIVQLLFDDWLAERRRTARIEWYWGNATQAARV